MYQCVATNSAGTIWTAAYIEIHSSGNHPNPPENIECIPYDDHNICLKWDVPNNVTVKAFSIHSITAGSKYRTTVKQLSLLEQYYYYHNTFFYRIGTRIHLNQQI